MCLLSFRNINTRICCMIILSETDECVSSPCDNEERAPICWMAIAVRVWMDT